MDRQTKAVAEALWGDRYIPFSKSGRTAQNEYYRKAQAAIEASDVKLIKGLVEALRGFNPYKLGYGNSLSHDRLGEAWEDVERTR